MSNSVKANIEQNELKEGKLTAIFSYIPFLCFIPLLSNSKDRFTRNHGKQGLLLLMIEVIALVFLIDFFSHIFWLLVLFLCLVFAIVGILKVLLGKYWKIPYIGNIFEKYEI